MAASQQHMHAGTPMGAQLVDGGATFRTWAPAAKEVYLVLQDPGKAAPSTWQKNDEDLLVRDAQGYWGGFFPGVTDGSEYRFWVVGDGSEGFKRDPYARELHMDGYPQCNCIVRDPHRFAWHDEGFRPPAFSDLIVYPTLSRCKKRKNLLPSAEYPAGLLHAIQGRYTDGISPYRTFGSLGVACFYHQRLRPD